MSFTASQTDAELADLISTRDLAFPIASKREFIEQMTRSREPISFRGVAYNPEFAAGLVPDFFFPVTCEQDMLEKVLDLITARGLAPLRRSP